MATEISTGSSTDERPEPVSPLDPRALVARGIIVFVILIGSLVVWRMARSSVVTPFDSFVTEQACRTEGTEMQRSLIAFERSNRFGLRDRSFGYCTFGPVGSGGDIDAVQQEEPDDADAAAVDQDQPLADEEMLTVALDEIEFGPLYRLAKAAGIIIQLFAVSIFLRFVVDPAMDIYRMIVGAMSRG